MRTRHGRYVYALTELPMGFPAGPNTPLLDLDVGDTLAFGADLRTAYVEQHPGTHAPTGATDVRTFIPMQGDLYVALTAFDGLSIYFDQGVHGSYEASAMYGHELGGPGIYGYARIGHFMPPYGLRLANHNVFVRQEIGFGPRDKDTGLELGLQLGPLFIQGAILSGSGSEAFTDDNRKKAIVGRLELLGALGPLRLMLGASVYWNESGSVVDLASGPVDTRTDHLLGSVHWGAALGRFVYLGEADLVSVTPFQANTTGTREYSFRSFQELDIRLIRGLELLVNYEYRQPDLDLKSGQAHRFSGGVSFFPMPSLEIFALYRYTLGNGRDEAPNDGYQELIAMVHAYF